MQEEREAAALDEISDFERSLLDGLAPEAADRFLAGADPAGIELLAGGDLGSWLAASASAAAAEHLRLVPLDPCRIADTRRALGKFSNNEIRGFVVRGEATDYTPQGGSATGCGIPGLASPVGLRNGARAALLSIKVIDPEGVGNFRIWSSSRPQPAVTLLNYRNTSPPLKFNHLTVVPLCDEVGMDPCIFGDVKARMTRAAHLVLEVHGYFVPAVEEVVAGPGLVGGGTDGAVALAVEFAGSGGAATAARSDHVHAESVPPGAIVMWSGSLADIPAGWALCDGADGRPDLRDRFILGAAAGAEPGATGGAHAYSLTEAQLAPHGHAVTVESAGAHNHTYSRPTAVVWADLGFLSNLFAPDVLWDPHSRQTASTSATGAHGHAATAAPTGAGAPIDNRPAFFELAFIIKL